MSEHTASTPSTRRVARTRGAASGVLLVLLGAWGGLAPFIGPLFDFGFTPDKAWHWTAARGWYEVAPGAAILVGGLLLLAGTSRVTTTLGAWLGILAGGWLVIGPAVSSELTLGSLGAPLGDNGGVRAAEQMAFFFLLGAVVIFLAAAAFGRLSVVTVRDVRVAEQREAARVEAEQAAERDAAERAAYEREFEQRRHAEREAYERQSAERDAAARSSARDSHGVEDPAIADDTITQRPAMQARPYDQPADDVRAPSSEPNPYPQNPYDQPGYGQQAPYAQPAEQQPTSWGAPNPPQR